MRVRLVDIIPLHEGWETCHRVRALEIGGRCLALAQLNKLQREQPKDFEKLMKVVKLAGQNTRVRNPQYVKRGKRYPDVYEMRGGNARLFFFYRPGTNEIVVCTNLYWKTKNSQKEQDAAFGQCERLRKFYLDAIANRKKR